MSGKRSRSPRSARMTLREARRRVAAGLVPARSVRDEEIDYGDAPELTGEQLKNLRSTRKRKFSRSST